MNKMLEYLFRNVRNFKKPLNISKESIVPALNPVWQSHRFTWNGADYMELYVDHNICFMFDAHCAVYRACTTEKLQILRYSGGKNTHLIKWHHNQNIPKNRKRERKKKSDVFARKSLISICLDFVFLVFNVVPNNELLQCVCVCV